VIIAERSSVERLAIEERRVVDEVKLHAVEYASVYDGAESILIVVRNRDASDEGLGIVQLGLAILGNEYSDLVSEFGECLGECSDDISEAAGFRKWNALRCGESYMHEDLLRACAAE
jgi:hypothetical protein